MPDVAIVTLTRYPDIFEHLAESVRLREGGYENIVVTSGGATINNPNWRAVEGPDPFVYARNANLGITAAGRKDVVLVNDDVQFLTPGTIATLSAIASANPQIGILSPQVFGGVGNRLQRVGEGPGGTFDSHIHLCFVCVYIPRATIDKVGLLDERFVAYGGDDVDYCWRTQDAGLSLTIVPSVRVRHGHDETTHSSSFLRLMTERSRSAQIRHTDQILRDKWNGRMRRG